MNIITVDQGLQAIKTFCFFMGGASVVSAVSPAASVSPNF